MTELPDVAAFIRQHAACGDLVRTVHSERDGGYTLTITCACGAVHNRWVTADEARGGSPPNASQPASRQPPPAASPELLAALDAALAEPIPPAPPRTPVEAAAPPAGTGVEIPPVTPAPPRPARATQAATAMNTVIREAVAAQQAAGETQVKEPPRKGWILASVTVAVLAIAGAAMLWLTQSPPGHPTQSASAPPATLPAPPAHVLALSDDHRRAFETAVHSLQQLQSVSNTGNTFPFYRSRVEMMQDGVRAFLLSSAPDELRAAVRGVADIHQLASEMWSARLEDRPDALARLERSEPLRTCPAVARVLEFSERAPGAGSARSHVLGSAIPLLWQCSGERLAALEQRLGGR